VAWLSLFVDLPMLPPSLFLFFFTALSPSEICPLSLHDALPIWNASAVGKQRGLGESTKFLAVHKGFQDILETFVDREELRRLTQPTLLPNGRRIPGLKLDQPRQLALMHSLVRFCYLASEGTFTTRS